MYFPYSYKRNASVTLKVPPPTTNVFIVRDCEDILH